MRRKIGAAFITLGAVCLLAAFSLWAYNMWDAWRAGQLVNDIQIELEEEENKLKNTFPRDEDPSIFIDGYEYIGTLSVSRFGLALPVISAWSYPGLRVAPCRYTGSVSTDDLVICGHNYERHFGNMRDLDFGDTILFTDIQGHSYTYEVEEVLILKPTDVEKMITGDWDLTLFTCTPGGQARVTVRCRLIQ